VTRPRTTRSEFGFFADMPTRWMDNDVFGHVNNVVYYSWIDTAVAEFLLSAGMYGEGGLALDTVPAVGVVVETQCRYLAPIAFPDRVTVGLRVARLGNTSIRYELAVFRNEEDLASAEAHFVHVYVDRWAQDRTVPLPDRLRAAAAPLLRPQPRQEER
jgi:acyl-CoA thioester hydrolase